MPAKSTSPEAAQKRVWKAEIKDLNKAATQIRAEFRAEQKQLIAASEKAHKAVLKFQVRAEKKMPKLLADIERRIGILKGRIGI
jgi:hypothetical protein